MGTKIAVAYKDEETSHKNWWLGEVNEVLERLEDPPFVKLKVRFHPCERLGLYSAITKIVEFHGNLEDEIKLVK